jgi:hypothetical protein
MQLLQPPSPAGSASPRTQRLPETAGTARGDGCQRTSYQRSVVRQEIVTGARWPIGLRDGLTRGHSRHGWCSPNHLTCALRPRDGSVGSACWTDRTDRSRASAFPSLTMQACQIAVSVPRPPGDLLGPYSSEDRCGRARHPRSRSLRSRGSPHFRLTP